MILKIKERQRQTQKRQVLVYLGRDHKNRLSWTCKQKIPCYLDFLHHTSCPVPSYPLPCTQVGLKSVCWTDLPCESSQKTADRKKLAKTWAFRENKKKSILKVLPLHTSLCILVSIFPEDKFTKMEISIQKLGGLNTLFPIMYWQISFQTFCSSYSQSHSKSCFLKAFLSLFTFRNKASWAGFHCWSILNTLWDIPVHGL